MGDRRPLTRAPSTPPRRGTTACSAPCGCATSASTPRPTWSASPAPGCSGSARTGWCCSSPATAASRSGLITALQFGPTLLLSMYGGVLADRYAKRRVLVDHPGADGRAGAACSASWSPPTASPCGTCSCWPPGWARSRRSTPRSGSRSSRRWSARGCWPTRSSLNSTIFNGARLVGPAVAGLLIGGVRRATPRRPSSSTRRSFAFTIGALLAMRADELRPSPPVARAARPAAGRRGLHLGAPRPRAGDGAGLRHRHLRLQLPGDHRADGPRGVRPRRRGVRAALDRLRRRLAERRPAVHPAQRPAAAAVPGRLGGRVRAAAPSSPA